MVKVVLCYKKLMVSQLSEHLQAKLQLMALNQELVLEQLVVYLKLKHNNNGQNQLAFLNVITQHTGHHHEISFRELVSIQKCKCLIKDVNKGFSIIFKESIDNQ